MTICIHIADSLHCTAETNTTLLSNYTAIINKQPTTKKKKKRLPKIQLSREKNCHRALVLHSEEKSVIDAWE